MSQSEIVRLVYARGGTEKQQRLGFIWLSKRFAAKLKGNKRDMGGLETKIGFTRDK